eukprot:14793580-Heterocapsa_arctica.AAC.3
MTPSASHALSGQAMRASSASGSNMLPVASKRSLELSPKEVRYGAMPYAAARSSAVGTRKPSSL